MIGRRLGSFTVNSLLGAGGMGEVYRARDSKLEPRRRDQSPARSLARDPERLARFDREAQVLASLNHPNIARDLRRRGVGDPRSCSSSSKGRRSRIGSRTSRFR